jgi:hypothetical protein
MNEKDGAAVMTCPTIDPERFWKGEKAILHRSVQGGDRESLFCSKHE